MEENVIMLWVIPLCFDDTLLHTHFHSLIHEVRPDQISKQYWRSSRVCLTLVGRFPFSIQSKFPQKKERKKNCSFVK